MNKQNRSSPKDIWKTLNESFAEMLKILRPYAIIVYGSASYSCFDDAKAKGIQIVDFPSKTAKAFSRRKQQ